MREKYELTDFVEMFGDNVRFWIEQDSSIHVKIVDSLSKTDPVELTASQAREIGKKLIEMADKLDAYDE